MLQIQDTMKMLLQAMLHKGCILCAETCEIETILLTLVPIKFLKVLENPLKFEYCIANSVIFVTLYSPIMTVIV